MGSKIPYDPLKDFATIGLATYVPYAIAVTASLPANNVKELIDLARASPRKLNVASPGVGTPNHLGAAQLMTLTGIEIVHVPYKGTALAINDLVAGNVQMIVTGLLQLLPLHQAGRVRILGVGHTSRLKAFPDIPTVAETVPGYYNTGWWGIVAPANTPKPIIDKLNAIMISVAKPTMYSTTCDTRLKDQLCPNISSWLAPMVTRSVSTKVPTNRTTPMKKI